MKNLHVIPNFIDRRSFEPAALDSKMVITAGRLSFQKGYDRLIDAWKIVHAHCPEWNLEIYGSCLLYTSTRCFWNSFYLCP